ncbi:unnamed protein product [Aureobasidium pullulans]|nr:unnamed protein product [Aureobasidium pullulans]
MDYAYDQIQEESLPADASASSSSTDRPNTDLNTEFQQAFKAVSASPWGARLGGFWSQAKKQGESLYSDAQKNMLREGAVGGEREKGKQKEGQTQGGAEATAATSRPDSLPADIVKEASSLVSLLRSKATAATANLNLQKIQAAEDAADEALLKFGTGIRSFLRDAVTVTAPSTSATGNTEVLFETNDAEGKRVIHSSRFDAQLHVIHTSAQSFTTDPDSPEYAAFASSFDIAAKTDAIAADLEKYPELRRAMEKLVPEKVDYTTFWTRYYFLRKVIQEEEEQPKKQTRKSHGVPTTLTMKKRIKQPHLQNSKFLLSHQPLPHLHRPNLPQHPPIHQHQHPHQHPHTKKKQNQSPHPPKPPTTSSQAQPPAPPPRQKKKKTEKAATAPTTTKKIDEESDEEDWE